MVCSGQVSSFYLHIRTYQPHDSTLLYLINVIVCHIHLEKLEEKKYGKEVEKMNDLDFPFQGGSFLSSAQNSLFSDSTQAL